MSLPVVCVDASFVLCLFVSPRSPRAWAHWDEWVAEEAQIWAPALLQYQAAEALFRMSRAKLIGQLSVEAVVEALGGLPVSWEGRPDVQLRAVRTAYEFGLDVADAVYLELARSLRAELWTADPAFAKRAGACIPRVNLFQAQEPEPTQASRDTTEPYVWREGFSSLPCGKKTGEEGLAHDAARPEERSDDRGVPHDQQGLCQPVEWQGRL